MGDQAIAAINTGDTQHGDERGQSKRQGEKAQDQAAPRKASLRIKRARNGNGEQHRKQARCNRLPDGETGDAPEIGVEIGGSIKTATACFQCKGKECAPGKCGQKGERQTARDRFCRGRCKGCASCRCGCHLLVAASHSFTHNLRFFATS
ncbi:hypothetical protein B989_01965 [Brucella sp. 56/94]|nr:hypothetical protein DK65_1750 [Brucella pinnipedialis]ENR13283.1 hypothetical protein C066_01571 [Brucella sp. UK5/01]ENT00092.1 hypothetical protein B989_01965 [Brucella sp. 56/94]ENT07927.1 hypothetical protein C983_01620 [Brucella sp. F23/97]ENT14517.1 hypothetical protein C067_01598 [Brucella sp. F8/99]ENT15852.1 hypothetical protein B998_01996 [Brucella sp. F96/2]ENT21507.1 hypothetical protein C065_01617 [Brucella sp. UK1/97]ENT22142.1 hypothetical protein C051_01675 [Brucella sp. 